MLKKLWTNGVWLMWCMAFLSAVGVVICPPLAGVGGGFLPLAEAQGVDSYTKLMLHADGSDQGTSFTDSSSGAKTVTNAESYDSYTKLMLHMNGADASTAFTDSATGKTVTANFNAQIDTAQNKFGEASGMFNVVSGYQDRLTIADSDDWNFGSGDFTIDFWVRFDTLTGDPQTFVSQRVDDNNTWNIRKNASNVLSMTFYYGGVMKGEYSFSWTPSINTWYHLAFVRYGSSPKTSEVLKTSPVTINLIYF